MCIRDRRSGSSVGSTTLNRRWPWAWSIPVSYTHLDVYKRQAIDRLPGVEITAHFHNTRGQGLANAYAALLAGCTSFESSFGELGGCPVPAGSTGNIATEDLVSMFHEMGVETGLDLSKLIEAAREAQTVLGRRLTSHSIVAGGIDWSSTAR